MKLNTFKQSILAYLCNTCQKQFQSKFLSMLKNIIIFEINNKQKDYFHFSLLITKPIFDLRHFFTSKLSFFKS